MSVRILTKFFLLLAVLIYQIQFSDSDSYVTYYMID